MADGSGTEFQPMASIAVTSIAVGLNSKPGGKLGSRMAVTPLA